MITIKEIEYNSAEYTAEIELRYKVLRQPLGLHFSDTQLKQEYNQHHFSAFDSNNTLVGCLLLKPIDESTIQIRQVAIAPEMQGLGIGKQLVKFSEEFAHNKGYKKIILHARDVAVDFYTKLGYKITSDIFIEVTIPHYTMEKKLIQNN